MSQPEFRKVLVPENGDDKLTDAKTVGDRPITGDTGRHDEWYTRFKDNLEDAERLLKYAAEVGIEIDPDIRSHVLAARTACRTGWNETTVANLLDSFTKLAARLKPVTAESLRASSRDSQPTVRTYWAVAICLAILIIPFSVASFVTSAISDAIRKDIATANELAVRINTQVGSATQGTGGRNDSSSGPERTSPMPAGLSRIDVVTELQIFASSIRDLDTRARQLNRFIFNTVRDPFADKRADPVEMKRTFQLPIPLVNLAEATDDRIHVYQDARSFGQGTVDEVSVFYGAIGTCFLPVLYALLGTCAYLLRTFEQEMAYRTFVPSHADFPRFMIAAIAGAVVGLFNNFTVTQGASIPPLAIAFLVGYAVDVFYSFLEGLIQTFAKNKSTNVADVSTAGH